MTSFSLGSSQKSILRKASPTAIRSTFDHLDVFFRRDLWIGLTNRYREDTIGRLYQHKTKFNRNLAQYITVSSLLHCFDAWIFLSRAIGALKNGDPHTAHHLAYYAELRAAMSLLAGEGIGIFSTKHYVLTNSGQCELIPNYQNNHHRSNTSTHTFTWLALEHWSKLSRSKMLVQHVLSPSGIPLATWLNNFGSGINAAIIGNEWLTTWGLDLRIMSHDHEGRNEVSYRPNYLLYQPPIPVLETSTYIQQFWELLQPIGGSRFEIMDRFLLNLSLRKIYTAITGQNPEENIQNFQNRLTNMLNSVNPQGLPRDLWIDYFLNNNSSEIISSAFDLPNVTFSNRHHLSVISRATLLLRIATGSIANMFSQSSITKEDISFWWENYCIDYGFSLLQGSDSNLEDLWSDIEIALGQLTLWNHSDHTNQIITYHQWGQECATQIKVLEECERASFWGIGL